MRKNKWTTSVVVQLASLDDQLEQKRLISSTEVDPAEEEGGGSALHSTCSTTKGRSCFQSTLYKKNS